MSPGVPSESFFWGYAGFQGGAGGREGLLVGLWLLALPIRGPITSDQQARLTCTTRHPSWQKRFAEGSPAAPRPRASLILHDSPLSLSLSCSFSHENLFPPLSHSSHLSGSPFSAVIPTYSFSLPWTLPHPCPHAPFKSCFYVSPSLSHLYSSFLSTAWSA